MSVIGNLGGLTGRKLGDTLGKRQGYYHGHRVIGDTTRNHQCAGGQPNNGGQTNNQMPAIANGSMKKIINSVYVDGGGRLDLYSSVAGLAVLRGNNPGLGKVTLDFDHPFVTGDLINWQFQRNSTNGNKEFGAYMEIEWQEALDNIQHWYGGLYVTASFGNIGYWQIGEMTRHGLFPLTQLDLFQRPMLKSGVVLDYGYYGNSPVGVDNTPFFDLLINGSSEASMVVTQTGSRVFSNNVGVNVSFAKGDLINLSGMCASNADTMTGLPTMRIKFD